jgi:hypothetical protein
VAQDLHKTQKWPQKVSDSKKITNNYSCALLSMYIMMTGIWARDHAKLIYAFIPYPKQCVPFFFFCPLQLFLFCKVSEGRVCKLANDVHVYMFVFSFLFPVEPFICALSPSALFGGEIGVT